MGNSNFCKHHELCTNPFREPGHCGVLRPLCNFFPPASYPTITFGTNCCKIFQHFTCDVLREGLDLLPVLYRNSSKVMGGRNTLCTLRSSDRKLYTRSRGLIRRTRYDNVFVLCTLIPTSNSHHRRATLITSCASLDNFTTDTSVHRYQTYSTTYSAKSLLLLCQILDQTNPPSHLRASEL